MLTTLAMLTSLITLATRATLEILATRATLAILATLATIARNMADRVNKKRRVFLVPISP